MGPQKVVDNLSRNKTKYGRRNRSQKIGTRPTKGEVIYIGRVKLNPLNYRLKVFGIVFKKTRKSSLVVKNY